MFVDSGANHVPPVVKDKERREKGGTVHLALVLGVASKAGGVHRDLGTTRNLREFVTDFEPGQKVNLSA
jgi:hypothetical protein